jgi:hypothetical protein
LSSKFQVKDKIFLISFFWGGWLVCAQADPFPTKRPSKMQEPYILRLVDFFKYTKVRQPMGKNILEEQSFKK